MTMQEQEYIKQEGYKEAMRYLDNAKDNLKLARRDGRFFRDAKYVSSASGIAYRGILVALDTWLKLKDVDVPRNIVRDKDKSKSIDFYRTNLAKLDRGLLRSLNGIYKALHLYGYYDCCNIASTIDTGFEIADEIMERIKPMGVA